ncbi:hypothetical protein AT05_10155 [Schleiferia thermophila str. Yellowstone]|jgi:hypothetical protein|uniref:hypothetical protein n=1 Tax=Schleiferia thermophila TaxID=884107 RepID=UPI0004E66C33|nr:hypothetical protein [Schleiferia thermophila]KFD38448.1 hypothetical protein AT05_10155 [Schleiferia thermophila str. Yellowstone]PMB17239.1 hypothetical protein CEN47_26250 [Fischerella thermalis CCMEE 5319]
MLRSLIGTLLVLNCSNTVFAQKLENGKWVDDNLTFKVVYENIRKAGELQLCIANLENDLCIGNLMTPFEVFVYDRKDSLIWSSIWTGTNMQLKFKKRLPLAAKVHIKAKVPYVINKLTTTRIYQQSPLELLYVIQ